MKRITLLLSATCLALSTSAQVLTLDSCISMALKANRQIESARLETRQRDYSSAAMKANFLPNFKASARDIYSSADGALTLPPGLSLNYKVENVIQAGVTVEQPIYMGGKITSGYKMSRLASDIARQNERLTESQVIVETEEAYALLVRATELKAVAIKYDSLLLRLKSDVVAAHSHGMASHNDVLKVEVKKNEAELQLRQAENAQRLARMNLCRQIALPLDSEIEIDGQTTGQTVSNSELNATSIDFQTTRPEAIMLGQKVQLAEQKVRAERADFLPQIGIAAGYSYINGLKVNDNRLLDTGNFAALLNVSIPLFHFGEGRNKVRAARMEAQQARVEQQDKLEQMQLEVTREANNVEEAQLELDVTTRNLEQAAENLRISQKSYTAGMESLSDLLEAQTLYQKALASQVEARCLLSLSRTRYRKAIGQ